MQTHPEKFGAKSWVCIKRWKFSVEYDSLKSGRCCPWSSALIRGLDWIWRFYSAGLNGDCGIWKGAFYSLFYQGASLLLCIRITDRLLVKRVGYGKRHQEFGLFEMLLEFKYRKMCSKYLKYQQRKEGLPLKRWIYSQTTWAMLYILLYMWESLKYLKIGKLVVEEVLRCCS